MIRLTPVYEAPTLREALLKAHPEIRNTINTAPDDVLPLIAEAFSLRIEEVPQ